MSYLLSLRHLQLLLRVLVAASQILVLPANGETQTWAALSNTKPGTETHFS